MINDVTRQITIARVQQMYDDEYDDTYDEFESTEAYVHLNDKQDPVARELADLRYSNNSLSCHKTLSLNRHNCWQR